jgi:hypothetical protein
LVKTPVLAARWYVAAAGDGKTTKKQDKTIAEFINHCLFQATSSSWPQTLTEILTMLDFGFSAFEVVYKMEEWKGRRRVKWKKFAQRHALDAIGWHYDSNGGPKSLEVMDPNRPLGGASVEIPINRLLAFTFEREGGDFEGTSVLRPAYKHWYYKDGLYKVDAIQKERHGIGIPVIKLPVGFSDTDKALADEMGRNLRTNEKAHIVLPPLWDIMMLKLEGNPVNALESIEHHDMLIAREILGQFLNQMTSAASAQEDQQTLFLKSTRFIAEVVRDVFNKFAIPTLVNYNWPKVTEYPELRVRRIGDTMDWRTTSFAMRNFVGAGILRPDDPLEQWVRDEMDLPPMDLESTRIIVQPLNEGDIPDGTPDGRPGPGGAAADAAHQNGGVGAGSEVSPPSAGSVGGGTARLPRQSSSQGNRSARSTGGRTSGKDNSGG